jgi:hypothetical protein
MTIRSQYRGVAVVRPPKVAVVRPPYNTAVITPYPDLKVWRMTQGITMNEMLPVVLERMKSLGFAVFTEGDYDLKHLHSPINVKGGAILVADRQYRGVYKLAKHRGKYQALCQRAGNVSVYRDDNRDSTLDLDENSIEDGMFGINIHRAHPTLEIAKVRGYSAGCQVFKDPKGFADFMKICRKQVKLRGWDTFSYTLLDQWW